MGPAFELSPPEEEEYGRTQSSPATPSGRTRRSWAQFGPRLKVEGKGRRWQRLPSPLGSAGDAGDEFEEEGVVGLGLDGVGRSPEGGRSLEVSPVIGVGTPELSSEGSEAS